MECSNLACNKKFMTIPKLCRNCVQTKYCSDECREQDWQFRHKKICSPGLFSLKDFQVTKQNKMLGKGAYGEVQLVQHVTSKVQYALKVIKKRSLSRSSSVKMMQREIAVQKKLVHKNIIRLFGHIEDIDSLYLVLEYAEKGNLFHYIRRKKKLPEDESWFFFIQVCTGVHYLHENSITHRDLKPENILLDNKYTVKICDFGWCAEGTNERSTYCGTLDYMAPEILRGYNYSNKVDIWALGVLLYEMTHGFPPFNAKSDSEKSRLIRLGNFKFNEDLSTECKDLIKIILQDTPETRPNILQILTHPWITSILNSQKRVKIDLNTFAPGQLVSHPDHGDGIIVNLQGLVCEASFTSGVFYLVITEFPEKNRNESPDVHMDEEKEYEQKLLKNYPPSYKSGGGSRGRPPRPKKISIVLNGSYKKSLKSDSGCNSPQIENIARGESNKLDFNMKKSLESSSSAFSSSSEGVENVYVNPEVMAQRLEELERLQKQLEGPASLKVREHEKKKKKKGFFSKLGGVFGFS